MKFKIFKNFEAVLKNIFIRITSAKRTREAYAVIILIGSKLKGT